MSTADALASTTYSAGDQRQLGRIHDALAADEALDPLPRYYLVGSGTDEPIELPEEIYQVLRQAVDAMQKGLSVTISPTSQTLTTQQAADLLGISRPTLIKTLDSGKLPYTRSGTHRRLALTDVLDYREKRRQEQYATIEELSVEVDESTDIDKMLDDLKSARKAVSTKRRAR